MYQHYEISEHKEIIHNHTNLEHELLIRFICVLPVPVPPMCIYFYINCIKAYKSFCILTFSVKCTFEFFSHIATYYYKDH